MHIRKYIRKIVDDGSQEEMVKLADILEEIIENMQEFNHEDYEKYKMKLYVMAYGEHLTEDLAHEIVNKMKPYGERWSIEETSRLQQDYGMQNIDEIDFYVVINHAYNDFRELFDENINNYIKYTDAFINDVDAKPNKVFRYFVIVPE